MASAGEELTLSGRLAPGTVGRAGEAGMECLPQKYTVLPAWLWPRASSFHLPSRSLWVSFVPARGCPFPLVSTDTGKSGRAIPAPKREWR